jgi:hypothetical protein
MRLIDFEKFRRVEEQLTEERAILVQWLVHLYKMKVRCGLRKGRNPCFIFCK